MSTAEDEDPSKVLTEDDFRSALIEVASLTGLTRFVVVGTGCLVVSSPDCDASMIMTRDFDMYAPGNTTHALIRTVNEKLGQFSAFAKPAGFYIQFTEERCNDCLPEGWEDRATTFVHDDIEAICIAPVDLALNKLQAGRPKDYPFVGRMLALRMVSESELSDLARLVSKRLPEEGEKQLWGISVARTNHLEREQGMEAARRSKADLLEELRTAQESAVDPRQMLNLALATLDAGPERVGEDGFRSLSQPMLTWMASTSPAYGLLAKAEAIKAEVGIAVRIGSGGVRV